MKPTLLVLTLLMFFLGILPASAQVHFFSDDQDERVVAAVEPIQSLGSTDEAGPNLALRFSAKHPNIDAVIGWQNPHGMNRNSCFQLNMLSQKEGRLTAVTYDIDGRLVTEARQFEVLHGPHREHVRLPDGTFRYNQIVEPSVVTGFELHGAALPPGKYETDIWAYGERRMNLRLVAENTPHPRLRILGVKRVAHGDADPERGHFPSDQSFIAADDDEKKDREEKEEEPKPPPRDPVAPAKWKDLTLEEKWAAFDSDVATDRAHEKDWGGFLYRQKDDVFMEQLALHHESAFETLGLGWNLKGLESDRWIRTSTWFCNTSGGHGVSIAYMSLTGTNTESEVVAWFERYPEQLNHHVTSNLFNEIKERATPVKKITALPPHDPKVIYAPWFDPNSTATRAEFERALKAFAGRNQFQQPYLDRFYELVRTPNEDVLRRQSAILTCSHLWRDNVPFKDLRKIITDPEEDPRLREAAVLGISRVTAVPKYVIMHEVASDPEHPGWMAAIQYMNHYSDGFSLQMLEGLEGLDPVKAAQGKALIEARREKLKDKENAISSVTFLRLREAEARTSPIAPAYRTRLIGLIKGLAESDKDEDKERLEKFVASIKKLKFAEGAAGDDARALRNELSALAGIEAP